MSVAKLSHRLQARRPGPAALAALVLVGAGLIALLIIGPVRLLAQIEGERGIVPVAATLDIKAGGITVNATGKTAQEARAAGWNEAKRKAWAKLGGPSMPDQQLDSLVSAVVVEREQIGPRRYIATLGVVFDRARAGQYIGMGTSTVAKRSAPMLTLPVLFSGGTSQVYEVRTPWQAAWAQFDPGASAIDYVRPSGSGGDSLLITAGQMTRRSRSWWSNILSQFEASDVLIPVARLERQWPGGPVRGTFIARYGPDNQVLASFAMTANSDEQLPAMLDKAVQRMDDIYSDALAKGLLRPDPSLGAQSTSDPRLAALIAAIVAKDAAENPQAAASNASPAPGATPTASAAPVVEAKAVNFTVQFASPDVRAVDAALASVRSVPGVRGAVTTSLAMGGTSVLRVSYTGTIEELRAALQARGWTVSAGNNALSIRR